VAVWAETCHNLPFVVLRAFSPASRQMARSLGEWAPPVASRAATPREQCHVQGAGKDKTIMSVSGAPPCTCGGENVQASRTDHWGEGESAVFYLHYLLKCATCGLHSEDLRMRYLNAAGAVGARVRYG
jgi:hypothetical protein